MVNINDKVIGRHIQASHRQKQISQSELAAKLGVSESFMSRLECGRARINLERLIEISLCLSVPLLDLLHGSYETYASDEPANDSSSTKEELLKLINVSSPVALDIMLEVYQTINKHF